MKLFNVYGISDWSESMGERFPIFLEKPFENEEEAKASAQAAYSTDLVVEVEEVVKSKKSSC